MNLYEIEVNIKKALENLEIDETTGELLNVEELEKLEQAKTVKIENIALYIKNKQMLIDAIKEEEKALKERRRAMENYIKKLKIYLSMFLNGIAFETSKVRIRFIKKQTIELVNEKAFIEYCQKENYKNLYTVTQTYRPNKIAINSYLKNNENINTSLLNYIKIKDSVISIK